MLLFTSLYSCQSGFESCLRKVNDLGVVRGDTLVIPIEKNKNLIFSKTPIKNALKQDPFLGLYVVANPKTAKHPFKIHKNLPYKELANIKNEIICGTILKHQNALESFGEFFKRAFKPAVVLNGCCELVAINTPKGVIEERFIKHALQKGGVYGDIGIRVKQCENNLVVESLNPFVKSDFSLGDRIVSLNGKKITDERAFNEAILFASVGSVCDVVVQRCKKTEHIQAKVFQRKGGGLLSDTFLETLGVYLDETLRVTKTASNLFKTGDRIQSVNTKSVKTLQELRRTLGQNRSRITIGINRSGLDLFLHLKGKN